MKVVRQGLLVCIGSIALVATASAEVIPEIGPWGHTADECTNWWNQARGRKECRVFDGGEDTNDNPWRCINQTTPRPWPDESTMVEKAAEWYGGIPATFHGWLVDPADSVYCVGFFDTGQIQYKLGVESRNFGMISANNETNNWGGQRTRTVQCPDGTSQSGNTCVRQAGIDPYKQYGECPANGTNPINTFTGAKYHTETDYRGEGPSPLEFKRYYSSGSKIQQADWLFDFGMGRHWRHNYARRVAMLEQGSSRRLTAYLENGDRVHFEDTNPGGAPDWQPIDADVHVELTELTDAGGTIGWSLRHPTGETESYDAASGRLETITSREGFTTLLAYNPDGTLDRVTGAFDDEIRFTYHADGFEAGKIASIVAGKAGSASPAVFRYDYEDPSGASNPRDAVVMLDRVTYPDETPDDGDNPFKDYLYAEADHTYGDHTADVFAGTSSSQGIAPISNLHHALTGIIDENGARYATYKYKTYRFAGGYYRSAAAGSGHGSPDASGKYANQHQVVAYGDRANRSDTVNSTTTIEDAFGEQRSFQQQMSAKVMRTTAIQGAGCSGCGADATTSTFDPVTGSRTSAADAAGHLRFFDHDANGLETCQLQGVPDPALPTAEREAKQAYRLTMRTWDGALRLPESVRTYEPVDPAMTPPTACPADADADGEPDDGGAVWRKVRTEASSYDTGGRLTARSVTSHAGTDLGTRTTSFSYYDTVESGGEFAGLLKRIDGHRTDVADWTDYTYHGAASPYYGWILAERTAVDRPGAGAGTPDDWLETAHLTYDAHGRVTTRRDANGVLTTMTWHPRGWLRSTTTAGATTRYDFDDVGQLIGVGYPPDPATGDAEATRFGYDDAHRLTDVYQGYTDASGAFVPFAHTQFTLDARGNVADERLYDTAAPTYDPADPGAGPAARRIERIYDTVNRLETLIEGGDRTYHYRYDANDRLTLAVDPRDPDPANPTITTSVAYDALNRVIETIGTLSGGPDATATYRYDAIGRTESVTDPNHATTTYARNGFGEIEARTSPDTGLTQTSYDAAGNAIATTDARGITVGRSYDSLNRLLDERYPVAGEDVVYTWDGGTGCTNGRGRICRIDDAAGTSEFSYDDRGNLLTLTRTELGVAYTTQYAYDDADRPTDVTDPTGATTRYAYDPSGRLDRVRTDVGGEIRTLVESTSYGPDGAVTSMVLGNGISRTATFGLDGAPVSASVSPAPLPVPVPTWVLLVVSGGVVAVSVRLRAALARGAQTAVVLLGAGAMLTVHAEAADAPSLAFAFDAAGNLSSDGTRGFSYDTLDRLVSESGPVVTQSFQYDANSNRISDGRGSYVVAAGSNRLESSPDGPVGYDTMGNVVAAGAHAYVYDQSGRLSEVRIGGATVATYHHDHAGRRTRRVAGGDTTVFHFGAAGALLAETSASGQPRRRYAWRGLEPIAQVDLGGTETLTHLVTDHLATPRFGYDESGRMVWSWTSDAFGAALPDTDPDGDGTHVDVHLRFPGQYFESPTGLHDNHHRTYDPHTGRYLQPDPIGLAGGPNPYGYVGANPLGAADPLGLIEWTGTYTEHAAAFGVGGGVYTFVLRSECVDGRRAHVRVRAIAIGGGISIPNPFRWLSTATGGSITLTDPHDDIWVPGLAGAFGTASSTLAIGAGVSSGTLTLGDASTDISVSARAGYGLDALSLMTGISNIVPGSVRDTECDDCEEDDSAEREQALAEQIQNNIKMRSWLRQ